VSSIKDKNIKLRGENTYYFNRLSRVIIILFFKFFLFNYIIKNINAFKIEQQLNIKKFVRNPTKSIKKLNQFMNTNSKY